MCVCLYLVEGMLCAVCTVRVYRSHSTVLLTLTLSGRPSSPPDNTLYPAMLTVAASYSFLKRLLKLHSALLIITAALGSPIGTRTCPLSSEEEERRKAEKGGRAVQLSLRLAPCFFFFFSSHLKLWDTHLSLIAHQCSAHEKVLWICINTAYGSSSAGTRCVQKGRVLPMHYSPFKLPQ